MQVHPECLLYSGLVLPLVLGRTFREHSTYGDSHDPRSRAYRQVWKLLTFAEEHPGSGRMRYDVPSDGFEGAAGDEGHRRSGIGYEQHHEVLKCCMRDNHNSHCTWFVMRTAIYQRVSTMI